MTPSSRDLAFDALVEVTGANISAERGALNKALSLIKEQCDDVEGEILANVIRDMAMRYVTLWPEMSITPMALAKHWRRILTEEKRQEERIERGVNRIIHPSQCETCGGDRMVLKFFRAPHASIWQIEHRSKRNPEMGLPHEAHRSPQDGHEEWLPCPDCNPQALAIARDHVERFARFHPPQRPTTLTFDRPSADVESNDRSSREE